VLAYIEAKQTQCKKIDTMRNNLDGYVSFNKFVKSV